ncbi:hypothetical protein B0H14DRAFT_3508561 [Mycena olivaceomarginata]|nr:hypothetical protein B0H14DRAFT_3508561 [Mycena olivaceomarginata]
MSSLGCLSLNPFAHPVIGLPYCLRAHCPLLIAWTVPGSLLLIAHAAVASTSNPNSTTRSQKALAEGDTPESLISCSGRPGRCAAAALTFPMMYRGS